MRLPLLILHILAGTVGLLSGTFAIAVRKGSRLHRASGNIFTVAMLTLASSALCLAIMKSQHGNIIGSIITFYMIATAWLAGRRRGIGRLDLAALLVGAGGAVRRYYARPSGPSTTPIENAPAAMCFFLAAVLLLAAAGDIPHACSRWHLRQTSSHASPMAHVLRTLLRYRLLLPRPATGLSRFSARLHLSDRTRPAAIPLDDLLADSRPLQQCLQSTSQASSIAVAP